MKHRGSTVRSVSKTAHKLLTKSELQDLRDVCNSTVTDMAETLFAAQPNFSPEQFASSGLPPALAAERDALLHATAQLWQAWQALGSKIRTECYPTIQ